MTPREKRGPHAIYIYIYIYLAQAVICLDYTLWGYFAGKQGPWLLIFTSTNLSEMIARLLAVFKLHFIIAGEVRAPVIYYTSFCYVDIITLYWIAKCRKISGTSIILINIYVTLVSQCTFQLPVSYIYGARPSNLATNWQKVDHIFKFHEFRLTVTSR